MKALLDKLHARLGDFWWYSLMLFCACRAADLLNAFVGLWLVPKYVGIIPAAIFASCSRIVVLIEKTARRTLSGCETAVCPLWWACLAHRKTQSNSRKRNG